MCSFFSCFFLCPAKPRLCHADEPETVIYTGPHTQSKREIFQGTNRFLFLPFFGCLFDRFVVRGGLESEAEFFYFNFRFKNKFYFLGRCAPFSGVLLYAHPYPKFPRHAPPMIPTGASTDLSPKNRHIVLSELYNCLTPYLLGREAILIHCLLHNRCLLSYPEIPLDVLYTPRDRLSRIPRLLKPHRHQVKYLHTAPNKTISVPVCKLPREQTFLGQTNKTAPIRPQTTFWNVL